jgi:hypothetical protein
MQVLVCSKLSEVARQPEKNVCAAGVAHKDDVGGLKAQREKVYVACEGVEKLCGEGAVGREGLAVVNSCMGPVVENL